MKDATEKVLGVKRLPIFPLPLVLLPNELLPLHIFEPKYRQMLSDIQLENRLFGVSFFDGQDSLTNEPAIGTIGCVAELIETETLEDGRSNIVTTGVIRYEIESYVDSTEPYLIAEVSFFEDFSEDKQILQSLADKVFRLFKRIAEVAQQLSGGGILPDIAPADPQTLSFLAANAFNLPNDIKLKLLKSRSTIERLTQMEDILLQAIAQIEESVEITKVAKTNGHSNKKIDLDN